MSSINRAIGHDNDKATKANQYDDDDAVGMDDANRTAMNVWATQGENAFIKHVFTETGEERTLSYAEMRGRYG